MICYMSTFGLGDAWVGNELRIVTRSGIPVTLYAMRKPTRALFASAWAAELMKRTRVVYPLPPVGMIVSGIVAPLLFGRRFWSALANALFGRRESFRGRVACLAHLFVAAHVARQLRAKPVSHIHAQWIHSGGTIAWYCARLLDKSFSFTGHAADLFRDRVALEDKIRHAQFIVCISNFHRDFFLRHGARQEQLRLVYCGIDPKQFVPPERKEWAPGGRLRIRAAGRLVEKKGFTYLIDACAELKRRGLDLSCVIAGSGPLLISLSEQVKRLGLQDQVHLTGAELKQEQIPEFMYDGDLFCLPCVWASDNDVDGLPQMLMEAMACGLPAISTRLVGIPDLVIDGETGLLVEPNDAAQLAEAILTLRNDPQRAARLAAAGRKWVEETFDINQCLEPLIREFRQRLAAEQGALQVSSPAVAAGASE